MVEIDHKAEQRLVQEQSGATVVEEGVDKAGPKSAWALVQSQVQPSVRDQVVEIDQEND